MRDFTHPSVLEGIAAGAHWADPVMDPSEIDWAPRQAAAAIPFKVINGRPVNPCAKTGIQHGRNEMGHWAEALMADAFVTLTLDGCPVPFVLFVEREDGHGWALPGGHVEPGESGIAAALRELKEETGLTPAGGTGLTGRLPRRQPEVMPGRYVPDPRASDEAWAVTIPVHIDLGVLPALPPVYGGDDALRAVWIPGGSLKAIEAAIRSFDPLNGVFAAHTAMLRDLLG